MRTCFYKAAEKVTVVPGVGFTVLEVRKATQFNAVLSFWCLLRVMGFGLESIKGYGFRV